MRKISDKQTHVLHLISTGHGAQRLGHAMGICRLSVWYAQSRLRDRGLIERGGRSNRYRLTPAGIQALLSSVETITAEHRRALRVAHAPWNQSRQAACLAAMRKGITSRIDLGKVCDQDGLNVWRTQQQLLVRGLISQRQRGGRYFA